MRLSPVASAQRRAMRQRVRSIGGAFLLVAGVLVTLAALLGSSPSSAGLSSSRQLSETPSSHAHVHFQLHKHHKAATTTALNTTTTSEAVNATTATSVTAEEESSCGVEAAWEQNGGILVYVALLLYIFVALAIVCDDYFVTALEKITEALNLSQDVAGATFMAAGSSAPELFVALADNVFAKPEASLGIGTIVGSAIFNILIIISLSAILAGQVLMLDWRPLLRDSLWYCWAILVLTYAIWDGSVDIFESVLLFGSYICYCIYMSQNERVVGACCRRPEDDQVLIEKDLEDSKITVAADRAAQLVDKHVPKDATGEKRAWTVDVERVESSDVSVPMARQSSTGSSQHSHPHRLGSQSRLNPMFQSKYRMFQHHHSTSSHDSSATAETAQEPHTVKHTVGGLRPLQAPNVTNVSEAAALASQQSSISLESNRDEPAEQLGGYFEEIFQVPAGVLPKLWYVFTLPIVIAMRLTIPDCRYPIFSGTAGFTATFFISILWIAFLSHYTVVFATRFGCIAGIPSALMGLTIIAAGTSIPDALSSILVARAGHGDMAVSNALGSNVFDILLGLGLPFFLSNLIYKEPVVVVTNDLEMSIFILFGVLVAVVGLLIITKWRLRKTSGAFMIVLYGVYVVVSYLRGMGML